MYFQSSVLTYKALSRLQQLLEPCFNLAPYIAPRDTLTSKTLQIRLTILIKDSTESDLSSFLQTSTSVYIPSLPNMKNYFSNPEE